MLSNAKYKDVKIQRKILLEDDLAMIFIDFGLLQVCRCDNLHMTQCAKIIVGFMANVGKVFLSNVYKRFLCIFATFLTFF